MGRRQRLEEMSVSTVESHICVRQTALDLSAAGYKVIVLEDCCSSRRSEDHMVAMSQLYGIYPPTGNT